MKLGAGYRYSILAEPGADERSHLFALRTKENRLITWRSGLSGYCFANLGMMIFFSYPKSIETPWLWISLGHH
jgi:hypothetical protein